MYVIQDKTKNEVITDDVVIKFIRRIDSPCINSPVLWVPNTVNGNFTNMPVKRNFFVHIKDDLFERFKSSSIRTKNELKKVVCVKTLVQHIKYEKIKDRNPVISTRKYPNHRNISDIKLLDEIYPDLNLGNRFFVASGGFIYNSRLQLVNPEGKIKKSRIL